MNKIPKIINQIWNDQNVPDHFKPLINSWKENHPNWEYKLWTYEMNRNFIKKYDPDFLAIYDNYSKDIQRVDAARYFILKEMGGLFIDMDFECFKNIDLLLDKQQCVFGIEPEGHCKMLQKDMILCNAFMACVPQNDFIKKVCENLKSDINRNTPNISMRMDVLNSTGPFRLTEIYNNYKDKNQITLLTSDTIYPLTMMETRELLYNDTNISKPLQHKLKNSYALHYFLGTWWE